MKEEFDTIPPDSPVPEDGRALAVSALKSLNGPASPVGLEELSVEELTDLVLDQRDALDLDTWIEAVAALVHPYFDTLTREICEEQHLLLHPGKVADLALGRFIALFRLGRRSRPCSLWLRQILEDSIQWARFRNGFCIFQVDSNGNAGQKLQTSLAQTLNGLDSLSRRIVHFSWIDRIKPDRVAELTQLPLEEVEAVLESVLRMVVKLVTGRDLRATDGSGSAQSWKPQEEQQGEDG